LFLMQPISSCLCPQSRCWPSFLSDHSTTTPPQTPHQWRGSCSLKPFGCSTSAEPSCHGLWRMPKLFPCYCS
jgi:hypothetical protein